MENIAELVEAAVRLMAVVLPIIGVTGGIKGLVGGLPTLNLGAWQVPPGLYLSWLVALPLTAIAFVSGWLPPLETFGTVEAAIAAYWAFLAATSNMVRNAITGGGSEPAPA